MTTDAQTEARAIALAAARHVRNNADAEAVENIVVSRVATALAARDAELAKVKATDAANYNLAMANGNRARDEHERAERAEAQLTEANKALEPFAQIADAEDEIGREDPDDDRVWIEQANGYRIGGLSVEDFRAARRAREAQGGK
jgi:hypothetical protein